MIAAGKLDRSIRIERPHRVAGYAGAETITWTSVATVPAELVQAETIETTAAQGVRSTEALTFKIRIIGITSDDRLIFEGRPLNIVRVRELGRRRALEITCKAVA